MAFFLDVRAGSEEEKLPGTQQDGVKFSDINLVNTIQSYKLWRHSDSLVTYLITIFY